MTFARYHRSKIVKILAVVISSFFLVITSIIVFSESLVRWFIEERGSNVTGRELRIDGALTLDWHWGYVVVNARNIRLSNAADYREPDMVSVESLGFTITPYTLLLGQVELESIFLERPVLILERKTQGNANWDFPLQYFNEPDKNKINNFKVKGQVEIKQGRIIYRNAVQQFNLDLKLESINKHNDVHLKTDTQYAFVLSGNGKLQNYPFTLNAFLGSTDALRNPVIDFPLWLTLRIKETHVEMEGAFSDPLNIGEINAQLKIMGDNLADLFYLTSIPLPPTPPYLLQGQLTKKDGVWSYNGFTGEVGESDISGSLAYDVTGKRGFLKADLYSNVLDSADLGGFIGLPPPPNRERITEEQKRAVVNKSKNPKLIPDVPLNVERLRATDLDVMLTAKKINAPDIPFKGMDIRFNLKDGILRLDPFNAVLADGKVDGTIEVDARSDIPPMAMNLNFRSLSLNRFFENTRFASTTEGTFGGNLSVSGEGKSLADVLANSDGNMVVIVSGGKISLLLVEASDVDIGEAFPLIVGNDKSTKIRCGVADFTMTNGQLNSKTFVLDTDDSTLVGNVDINLKHEHIDARLDAKPKDSSLFSARIPITLSGNLKSPNLGLDSERTSARGAAAIALGTLLTPFAALLVFVDRGNEKDVDCHALIMEARN